VNGQDKSIAAPWTSAHAAIRALILTVDGPKDLSETDGPRITVR